MNILFDIQRNLKKEGFSKKERKEMLILFCDYFTSNLKYGDATRQFVKYKYSRKFCNIIKMLSDKAINYIISCRKYIKFGDDYLKLKPKLLVSKKDIAILKRLRPFLQKDIPLIPILSFTQVYINVFPIIVNKSSKYLPSVNKDLALEQNDLIAEFNIRLLEAYRKYIFSYDDRNFNSKVFYTCIGKALTTRILDILKTLKSQKSKINSTIFITKDDNDQKALENSEYSRYGGNFDSILPEFSEATMTRLLH